MEEIKQLIKEEAKRYAENSYGCDDDSKGILYNETLKDFKAGANFVLSKWQEANRWRKVSEELPEVRDESYQVLIRIANIHSSATVWNIRNQSDCDIIAKMSNSEWKTIE